MTGPQQRDNSRKILILSYWKTRISNNKHQRRIAMPLKVTIDTDECIGCQSCVELCPEAFSFDNDTEKAEVRPDMTGKRGLHRRGGGFLPGQLHPRRERITNSAVLASHLDAGPLPEKGQRPPQSVMGAVPAISLPAIPCRPPFPTSRPVTPTRHPVLSSRQRGDLQTPFTQAGQEISLPYIRQ